MTRTRPTFVPLVALVLTCAGAACGEESPLAVGADAGANAADFGVGNASDAGATIDAGQSPAGDAGTGLPDAGAPVDQCNPVTQTGCAPPEIKCVVEGPTSGTQCIAPSPTDLQLGAPCSGRDCAAGLACARVSASSTTSVCVKVCDLTSGEGCETLGSDFECRTRLTDTNWGACGMLSPSCDPYSQAPCEGDQACQPFLRRTGTWEFRCRTAGPGEDGDACGPGSSSACRRGLACVSTRTGAAFCRTICQTNMDCESTAQCNGVVSEPPFMYCGE